MHVSLPAGYVDDAEDGAVWAVDEDGYPEPVTQRQRAQESAQWHLLAEYEAWREHYREGS